jgi:hypothetical protein
MYYSTTNLDDRRIIVEFEVIIAVVMKSPIFWLYSVDYVALYHRRYYSSEE